MKAYVILCTCCLSLFFVKCRVHAPVMIIPPYGFRTTVATVLDANSKSDYIKLEYTVNNKQYKYDWVMPSAVVGEKYIINYDSVYPDQDQSYLLTECPVFLPGEGTAFTVGTIAFNPKNEISFGFLYKLKPGYSEKEYAKVQDLEPGNLVKNYPQLVKGAKFLVEYWLENPQRSILYIDRPVTDGTPLPLYPNTDVLRPAWDSIR